MLKFVELSNSENKNILTDLAKYTELALKKKILLVIADTSL